MNRSRASAAVLGTTAALAAAFLVPRTPTHAAATATSTNAGISIDAERRLHARATMVSLLQPPHDRPRSTAPALGIALCYECPPSRTLVRVLLRRHTRGAAMPPATLLTDRSWPALDTLARLTQSSVRVIPRLNVRVGITPVALDVESRRFAVGITDVITDVVALVRHPLTSPHGDRQ